MSNKVNILNKSFKSFVENRSRDYNRYGKYLVKDCDKDDALDRTMSYMADIVASVIPILLWDYLFILVGSGFLNYFVFKIFTNVLIIIICACILLINTILMVAFKGQTFGKVFFNFKVVNDDLSECENKTLIIRQLVGFGIPIVVLTIIFGLYGFIIYSLINALFVVVNKKHDSIIDKVLHTRVVKLNEQGMKASFEMQKEEVKPEIVLAENQYDLHIYSSFSQIGDIEVEDIFKKAQETGIKVISITDHNSIKANQMAQQFETLYNVDYIPGISIDCTYENTPIELLGYYIDYNDERYRQVEYEYIAREQALSTRRMDLLEEATGFIVDKESLLQYNRFQIITDRMVARQILTNKEYQDNRLLQPYLSGSKKDKPITHFVKDFFGEGGVAYVPSIYPNAKDMISLIKVTGGTVVLAHPMYSLKGKEDTLERLINEGIDGIELFTPLHSKNDIRYLLNLTKEHNLDTTAGSEYRGSKYPKLVLGKTTCPKDAEDLVKNFIDKHK